MNTEQLILGIVDQNGGIIGSRSLVRAMMFRRPDLGEIHKLIEGGLLRHEDSHVGFQDGVYVLTDMGKAALQPMEG